MSIVDDVLIAEENSIVRLLLISIKERCKIGTGVNGPAVFLFFSLDIIQESDKSVTANGDSNWNVKNSFPIDRP